MVGRFLRLFHLVFDADSIYDTIKTWTLGPTAAMSVALAVFFPAFLWTTVHKTEYSFLHICIVVLKHIFILFFSLFREC